MHSSNCVGLRLSEDSERLAVVPLTAKVLFITRYPWTGFACSERVALPHHQQDDHLDSGEMVKSDTLKF